MEAALDITKLGFDLILEKIYISGSNLSETDPQCSQAGWIVPEHNGREGKRCVFSGDVRRETGPMGLIPFWPGDRRGGTVPPYMIGECSGCGKRFIGSGPL